MGVHEGVQVILGYDFEGSVADSEERRIAQVFTSTVAGGWYGGAGLSGAEFEGACRQLLRAAYLGTLLAAADLGQRMAVLTLIGGGVFGNPIPLIWDAILWAAAETEPLLSRDLDVIVNGRNLGDHLPRETIMAGVRNAGRDFAFPAPACQRCCHSTLSGQEVQTGKRRFRPATLCTANRPVRRLWLLPTGEGFATTRGPPMPLLDHFNPPLNRTHPRRSFHGAWAAAMARLLNRDVLPPGSYAVPLVDRDGPIEIDMAALREQGAPLPASGAAGPQTWVAPAPVLAVAVDLPAVDGVEVQVFADDGDPRLAAAVELLSPRNKDRPAARQAFAVKCVGYLQQASSVVVVDTVTTRRAELNSTILSLLGVDVGAAALPLSSLSAVSYRAVGRDEEPQELQLWPETLALAQPLPTLPLWIAPDFSVPLDLEASYQMTCADLRIPQAG